MESFQTQQDHSLSDCSKIWTSKPPIKVRSTRTRADYSKEIYYKGFYGADFYADQQSGEQVDYVDVGYDWAEIRANCTLFTQLVQKVSGTQELIFI